MENIFRSLSFTITQLVYPLISYLYSIFEKIAENQFFTNEDIETISGNIYIIISACMLFTLGLKLLSAIVNPDALSGGENNQGTKRTAKSIFFSILLSLFLIIMIPIGFRYLYQIQSDVIKNHLVEKIVLGEDTSENHVPGQILASYAFASFCHPQETISSAAIANDGGNLYNLAITENIEYVRDMDGVINSKTDGEYDLEYHAILSPAVGIFLTYQMILVCIDIALRSIKLGLLQLITSIVLCGYVVSGTDLLKRWAKEVMSTYAIVFIKIAAMSFMVYGLSLLEGFLDRLDFGDSDAGFWERGLIRVFVIIGLLQLVHQLPDLINRIFGTNIQRRGGIRGRLGEMAAVGDLAQRAWDQLRTHPLQTGQRLISAPISAIGGAASHIGASIKKGRDLRNQMEDNNATRVKSNFAMMRTIAGGMVGSFGAMFRAGHSGWQNGNLQGIGGAYKNYNETHPTDMLEERANRGFFERLNPVNSDRIRTMVGAPTRLESDLEADKKLDVTERYKNWKTGVTTPVKRNMTIDEAKRNQAKYNEATELISKLTSSAESVIQKSDSSIEFEIDGFSGKANYAQLSKELEAMSASGKYSEDYIGQLSNDLGLALKSASHEVVANAISGTQAVSGTLDDGKGGTLKGVAGTDIKISGSINTGTFDGMTNDTLILESVMDSFTGNEIDGIKFDDLKTGGWETIDQLNISSTHHSQDIGRSLSQHERDIEDRVTSVSGRAKQQSHDLAQQHNNGGNNHGGNNG